MEHTVLFAYRDQNIIKNEDEIKSLKKIDFQFNKYINYKEEQTAMT